jgi:hypothetical protein
MVAAIEEVPAVMSGQFAQLPLEMAGDPNLKRRR